MVCNAPTPGRRSSRSSGALKKAPSFAIAFAPARALHLNAVMHSHIVAAMPSLQSPLNVSDREWFRSLKAGGAEPQVSRARESTPEARFFPVARSIRGPDKAFVGAVQGSIARSHFANIFQSLDSVFRTLDVKPDEKLGVYRTTDGAVVATFPMADALLDETVAASPFVSLLANSEGESWMGWTRVGGKNHLVAARRMREWPLIVSVSLPERTVYSGAGNRLLWRSMITIVAIAALSMLTLISGRQARREAALMGELEHRVRTRLLSWRQSLSGLARIPNP